MPGAVFLTGERVELRTVEEGDLPFLVESLNDPAVWETLGRYRPVNTEQERTRFEEHAEADDGVVCLLVCADGRAVGSVSLHPDDRPWGVAELGYWVAPDEQGHGYGGEAVELTVEYGFEHLRLHKVAAKVYGHNEPSRRLLRSAGFTEEGAHREEAYVAGEYRDLHHYGLLEAEWRADRAGE